MAEKKDDATKATHYRTNCGVGPHGKDVVVSADALKKWFGKVPDSSPEEHQAHIDDNLKRLLNLGAITPTEAPPSAEEEAKAQAEKAAAEKKHADEEAAKASAAAHKHAESTRK